MFLFFSITNGGLFNVKTHVIIRNGLLEKSAILKVHCKSKEDDLGDHFLKSGGPDFRFKFVSNPWPFGFTLFFCHFYWYQKDAVFDVYNLSISPDCKDKNQLQRCYWLARDDGFYFNNEGTEFPEGWVKKHDWRN